MAEADPAGPTLYYIRHGETAWSLTGQHTGRTDLALTETGEGQAIALAPWLGAIAFTHVFTSPLQRARRTCALAGLAAAALVEPDLAEWDYGDYEGELSSDIRRRRPGWSVFRDGCPGGESPGQIAGRPLLARRLRGRPGQPVDRPSGGGRPAFPPGHGLAEHSGSKSRSPGGQGPRPLERRAGDAAGLRPWARR